MMMQNLIKLNVAVHHGNKEKEKQTKT